MCLSVGPSYKDQKRKRGVGWSGRIRTCGSSVTRNQALNAVALCLCSTPKGSEGGSRIRTMHPCIMLNFSGPRLETRNVQRRALPLRHRWLAAPPTTMSVWLRLIPPHSNTCFYTALKSTYRSNKAIRELHTGNSSMN